MPFGKHKFLLLFLVSTLFINGIESLLAQDATEKVSGVLRLPPKVYALATIPDVTDMKERCSRTSMLQLWNDPEFEEFRDQIMIYVEEYSEQIKQHVGIGISEIIKIPQGEVTLAYLQDSEGQLGGVGIMDYGDQEDNLYKILDAFKLGMDSINAEQSSLDIEGTEVTDFLLPESRDEDDEEESSHAPSENHIYYFTKDHHFVISNKESIIKDVLARWDGKHEQSFEKNEQYKYITQTTSQGTDTASVIWYTDPIGLVQKLITKYGQGNLQAQMALGFFPSLGLNNLKAIGGSSYHMTEKFESISRIVIDIEQPVTGLPALFLCKTSHQVPPQWVPEDISSYNAMNWNVESAYNSIETMVDSIQGKGFLSSMINNLQQNEGGPQIHIKNDIIDQLTGEMQIISMIDPDAGAGLEGNQENPLMASSMASKMIMTIGIKDPNAFSDIVKNAVKTQGFPGEVREFQGATIYEMKDENTGISSGFTIHDGKLLFTSHIPLLEDALRATAGENSLVDSDEYKAISMHFPRMTSIIAYQKQEQEIKLFYDMLKSGALDETVPQIDFSTLPDFDLIRKYFSTSGSYATPDERGALLVSFTLKKEE